MSFTKNTNRKRIALILVIAMLSYVFVGMFTQVFAAEYGYVNDREGVNMRKDPDTSKNNILHAIAFEDKVEILGTAKGSGYSWYKIKHNGQVGYAVQDYITKGEAPKPPEPEIPEIPKPDKPNFDTILPNTPGHNMNFETELSKFPASYQTILRRVHKAHPSWIFVAGNTGLDWNTVIDKEFGHKGFRPNTIHNSYSDSWKSMEQGDYDFKNKWYIAHDSGGYVAASKSIIRYYMDPRNFLENSGIFQFFSAKFDPSFANFDDLNRMLKNTFMSGNMGDEVYSNDEPIPYSEAIMYAAIESGVSPYTISAIILQEQGTDGRGGCISGKVEGYEHLYNFFNIKAVAHSGRDAVENGLIHARNMKWYTRYQSILDGAKFFGRNYVNSGQHTEYLKKFNVMDGLGSVATNQYMTNVRGAYDEGARLKNVYAPYTNEPLVFEIPVFNNMPANPSPKPNPGNNNNFLDDIKINDGKLKINEKFDRYTSSYTLDTKNLGEITINPVTNDKNATVTGGGKVKLRNGKNIFNLVVTSTSGEVRTYKLTVNADGNIPEEPGWHSDNGIFRYVYEDGTYAVNCREVIDGFTYFFDEAGNMRTKWYTDSNGNTYYLHAKGGNAMANWQWIDGKWYIFDGNTYVMQTGWAEDKGFKYYLDEDGSMATGFRTIDEKTYFFHENKKDPRRSGGNTMKNWQRIEGKSYYFYDDGHMAINEITPDGYAVDENGVWIQ